MSNKRILVVDDETDVCEMLVELLGSLGYEAVSTLNGKEALEALNRGKFDLVISDLKMPEIDGRSLLRSIKRKSKSLPVVIITGYGTAATPDEMAALGADAYLAKPFTIKEIAKVVADLIGNDLEREKNGRRSVGSQGNRAYIQGIASGWCPEGSARKTS